MWLLESKLFADLSKPNGNKIKVDCEGLKDIFNSNSSKRSTIVIGNGLSVCAVYENKLLNGLSAEDNIGWSEVINQAFKKCYRYDAPVDSNSLILAEAVLQKNKDKNELLQNIKEGVDALKPSSLHKIIVSLKPHALITTNYDFLLEDTCEDSGYDWQCYVRDAWTQQKGDANKQTIFKMHGTLPPENRHQTKLGKYFYITDRVKNAPGTSVVISESDYDTCNAELEKSGNCGEFWDALKQPLIIFGKGVYWEDLSFMRMLRERKRLLDIVDSAPAYWILNSLSHADSLTLGNLGITPIVLNMPRKKESATYYFALMELIQWLTDYSHTPNNDILVHEWKRLLRKPKFVAIGLSAHNTAGRVKFKHNNGEEDYRLPSAGRRNLEFSDAEEYAGGSALTAMSVYAALHGINKEHGGALVSVVGDDIFSKEIFSHCQKWNIDSDAIASKQKKQSWRSTILVHNFNKQAGETSQPTENLIFPGQRVFLDRPFPEGRLGEYELTQFDQMVSNNEELRVVYMDKWLADDPSLSSQDPGIEDDRAKNGFLAEDKNRDILLNMSKSRPDVEILYETGGSGSSEARVERRFADCVNILTAGFPFFARRIICEIQENERTNFPGLQNFLSCNDPRSLDFDDERNAILDALLIAKIEPYQDSYGWINIPKEAWGKNAKNFINRPNKPGWLIVTLHDLGALAFDLSVGAMRYFPSHVDQAEVLNTAGAGDAFRGAFCFALTKFNEDTDIPQSRLAKCTAFSVYCASERCRKFSIADALDQFSRCSGLQSLMCIK